MPEQLLDFTGKVVLVTGGATGIGRATSLAFARQGPTVVIGDVDDRAAETVRVIEDAGGTGLFVYVSEHAGTNKATLAGFEVSDFDRVRAELAESGVEFERYDGESGVKTDEDGVFAGPGFRAAWFKDPDGNIFAING